jgi:type IX secretion system PorP/SprF family membrane protein
MIVNHNNIQKWIFDYFEGNLSLHEQIELKEFMKRNPQYSNELEAWEDARIEEDDVVPLYSNANALLVAEQTVLQRTWKYAAVLILLLGSGLTFLLIGNPAEEVALNSSSNESDIIVSSEFNINNVNNLIASADLASELPKSQINGDTPPISVNEPAVSESSYSGTEPGPSWSDMIDGMEKLDGKRVNPALFKHNGASNVSSIRNKAVERELRYHKDRVKKTVHLYVAKREKKRKLNSDPVAADIVNNGKHHKKDLAEQRSNKHDSEKKRTKKSFVDLIGSLFDKEIGLTNMHDPVFIVDNANPLDVNPALTGGIGSGRLNLSYRNQWAGSENNTVSYGVSYDQYVEGLSAGLGFSLSHMDYEDGMYKGYGASVSYAPRIEISKEVSLSVGAELSIKQKEVNFDRYNYDSQLEIDRGTVYDTYSSGYSPRADKILYKDAAMGMMVNTPYFFVGGSVDHIFESGQNLYNDDFATSYKQKRKFSVQVGTDYQKRKGSNFAISPQLIYTNQAGSSELWASSSVRFKFKNSARAKGWIIGTGVSSKSSLKGIVGVQGKHMRLMYGYDFTKSELSSQLQGSHEASLRILLKNNKNKSPLAFL